MHASWAHPKERRKRESCRRWIAASSWTGCTRLTTGHLAILEFHTAGFTGHDGQRHDPRRHMMHRFTKQQNKKRKVSDAWPRCTCGTDSFR